MQIKKECKSTYLILKLQVSLEAIVAAGAVPAIGTTMTIVDHMVEMAVVTAATVSDMIIYVFGN